MQRMNWMASQVGGQKLIPSAWFGIYMSASQWPRACSFVRLLKYLRWVSIYRFPPCHRPQQNYKKKKVREEEKKEVGDEEERKAPKTQVFCVKFSCKIYSFKPLSAAPIFLILILVGVFKEQSHHGNNGVLFILGQRVNRLSRCMNVTGCELRTLFIRCFPFFFFFLPLAKLPPAVINNSIPLSGYYYYFQVWATAGS